MAVLQNIREKCGVLVIVIVGVALLAFLLGDFLSSGRIGQGDVSVIAKINGTKVDQTEFNTNYYKHRQFYEVAQGSSIDANTEKNLRESAWNDILNKYVWSKYYEEVGIDISEEELEDLLYGPTHAHSIIVQNFGLQKNEKGEYDTKAPKNFFENADENGSYKVIADYWKMAIKEDQISSKYGNMISKGFYTPTALAKMYYEDQTCMYDLTYAYRDYSAIKDEDITVTDKDLNEYYNKHLNRFTEEKENRDIEYVVFDIIPSESDIKDIKESTEDLRKEMEGIEDSENVLQFAQLNSSNTKPEDRSLYKDHYFLNEKEVETIGFSEEFFASEAGTTSEVIMSGDLFICGKILETANRPDSVNVSHILLRPHDSITMDMCKATADSLADVLKRTKADSAAFAAMATEYSQDPGSKNNGGFLGDFTEGTMVTEFSEACFNNAAGTIQVVESPYGMHIIKINSQTKPVRKIKLAVLDQEIKFSDQTYEAAFQASNKFYAACVSEKDADFDKKAADQGLNLRTAGRITDMSDNIIPGIDNGREIVRWAFEEDRKEGDISSVFESSTRDKFLVVKLSKIRDKGYTPFEDTKETIEPEVKKQKKAEKMIAEMNGMTIEAIAQKFEAKSDTLHNVSFSNFSLPGLGLIEPKINAVAACSDINAVSAPIDGNNGVYVIKVIKKTDAPEKQDFENEKLAKMQEYSRGYSYKMNNAIIKAIKIDDRRIKFF